MAVWGASNYTYAEATLTQQLPDWIGSHVRAFQYFGCVPKVVVPDCLKGAVNRACRYEPGLNPTYAAMAEHYGLCVLPARPARPRDKAKVEAGVLIAQRWILAALRHHTFYNLADLNRAIHELLQHLNTRALRKVKKSRRELFDLFDRPHATSILTLGDTVEAFLKGERVAAHIRSFIPYGHTTLKEHMPPSHQKYLEWTPSRMVSWAKKDRSPYRRAGTNHHPKPHLPRAGLPFLLRHPAAGKTLL